MTDEYGPAARHLAEQIVELQAWKDKYVEAAKLWDDLELEDNDQVVEAVILAKIIDFKEGGTGVGIGYTTGMDWIGQLGLLSAAEKMVAKDVGRRDDGDD